MDKFEFADFLNKNLKSRTLMCKKGDTYALNYVAAGMVWMVESGIIITEQYSDDGREIGTGIYSDGMLLGISSIVDDSRCVMCRIVKDTVLIGYQTKEFCKLLEENSEACFYALKFACSRYKFAIDTVRLNALDNINTKIEKFNNMLSSNENLKNIDLPDNVIAGYLGIHPSSISRAKKKNSNSPKED